MANIGIIKFQLADIQFGIYADRILEIVRLSDFRRIPSPLPYVVGLTELRRYIVVIVDLRKRLGLSPIPLERGTTMIAMKVSTGMVGMLVESISHFRPISPEQILPPISIAGFPARLLHGVVDDDDNDILILPNFDDIFSSYIHLHLLPMTSSEKIAFQYRSTQGAITRTLENTLVSEGYLDELIIRKLPRAMELSSVHVHKVTSYYPHFQPRISTPLQKTPHSQAVKAGDETYSSLSKRLSTRGTSSDLHESQAPEAFTIRTGLGNAPQSRPGDAESGRLGESLHLAESFVLSTLSGQPVAPQELLAHPKAGKKFAETLRISPVSLMKFLTYYEQEVPFTGMPDRRTLPTTSTSPCSTHRRSNSIEEQLKSFKRHHIPLQEALRMLSETQCVLNRHHIHWLALHYKVSALTLSKLRWHFPDLAFRPDDKSEKDAAPKDDRSQNSKAEHAVAEQDRHRRNDRFFTTELPGPTQCIESVSRGFQYLSAHKKLSDDRAVRYVAAQLCIPTCRLSKMRNYYSEVTKIVSELK